MHLPGLPIVNSLRSAAAINGFVFTMSQRPQWLNSFIRTSGSLDATLQIWTPSTGTPQTTFSDQIRHPINAAAWSPDSQMLAISFGPKEGNAQPQGGNIARVFHALSG